MITLIHGDHIEVSRAELNRLKEASAGKELRVLDGKNLADSSLIQSLESTSLFGGDTVVVIERLFGKIGKQAKRIEELCKILVQSAATCDIIIWEDKEVGATVTKNLGPSTAVKLYKLPVLIFQFLDGIKPKNTKGILELYERLTATEAPELVFSMLLKRIRQLIQIADGVTPAGVGDWQLSRLTTQAKSFTMEKLIALYASLHDTEVRIKTGMSPFTMTEHIEQFIIHI